MAALDKEKDALQLSELRGRFIQRLMEMGGIWLLEAEKQVVEFNAAEADPRSLEWLALSIFGQWEAGEWRNRDSSQLDPRREYWKWLAAQPVGIVIEQAYEKNRNSIELMVALISLYLDHPELFEKSPDETKKLELMDRAKDVFTSLKTLPGGRAQWASFVFAQRLEPNSVDDLLKNAAPEAFNRLSAELAGEDSGTDKLDRDQRLSDFWDAQLVLAFANRNRQKHEFEIASEWFTKLIDVDKTRFPEALVEELYAGAGQVRFEQSKTKEAIEVVRAGCDRLGPNQGIGLWDILATYQYANGIEDDVRKALDQLAAAIQARGEFLRGNRFQKVKQDAEQSRLSVVKWHAEVLKAAVEFRFGNPRKAIPLLTNALSTQIAVPENMRLEATRLLAETYAKLSLWEMSARTLEDAVAIFPSDKALRRSASDAWQRAGVTNRAQEQLSLADDGSFDSALTLLQMSIASENTLPPDRRDPNRIRIWMDEAADRLRTETDAGNPPSRGWLFETIRLAASAPKAFENTNSEASTDSANQEATRYANDVSVLAQRYPKVGQLQMMATLALKSAGREDDAQVTMNNLAALKSEEPRWLFETTVRLALQAKEIDKAKHLIQQTIEEKSWPESEIRQRASEIWESAGDLRQAVEVAMPLLEQGIDFDRYRLGSLLVASLRGSDQQTGQAEADDWKPSTLLNQVVDALKKSEGEDGTQWKLLQASQVYLSFLRSKQIPELEQGTKLIAQVLAIRPRWSEALALAGDLQPFKEDPTRLWTTTVERSLRGKPSCHHLQFGSAVESTRQV